MQLPEASFCHWLTGLIDGEGTFDIRAAERDIRNGYHARQFDVRLTVSLRDDDFDTLNLILLTTGAGDMHQRKGKMKNGQGYESKPMWNWRVSNVNDLEYMALLLSNYPLRSRKRHQVPIWIRATELRRAAHTRKALLGTRTVKMYDDDMWAEARRLEQLARLARSYQGGQQSL